MIWQLGSVYWGIKPDGPGSVDCPLHARQCLLLLPSAQLPPQKAQDRGAEDDKHPGVHDGVEGEQTEHQENLEVSPMAVFRSEVVNIHLDLRQTPHKPHTISRLLPVGVLVTVKKKNKNKH